jgi:hypothetical protein
MCMLIGLLVKPASLETKVGGEYITTMEGDQESTYFLRELLFDSTVGGGSVS